MRGRYCSAEFAYESQCVFWQAPRGGLHGAAQGRQRAPISCQLCIAMKETLAQPPRLNCGMERLHSIILQADLPSVSGVLSAFGQCHKGCLVGAQRGHDLFHVCTKL